ncbi:MAG: hypothetical protein NVSMB26_18090 [Beijerinckiaceae bacterium]
MLDIAETLVVQIRQYIHLADDMTQLTLNTIALAWIDYLLFLTSRSLGRQGAVSIAVISASKARFTEWPVARERGSSH